MQFNTKRIISLFVVLFMFFSINSIVFAQSATQQIKTVEQKRNAIHLKIQSLSKLERQESNKLTKNQRQLEKNQMELIRSKNKKVQKERNISSLEKDLSLYLKQYNKRQYASADRIRCIYKTKHLLIFDLLLSTNSLSQFLDRIYYQNLIVKSDREKMLYLKSEAKKVAVMKNRLEAERKELSKIIRDIDRENSNIKVAIDKNKSMIEKIQKDKRAYEKSERELKKQSDRLASLISKTTRNSDVRVSGGFIIPVKYTRISSPFGWRIHPIFKSRIYHTGIDYAAPMSTPIRASNSGKVIFSGWYGGYGKVVIIDHGSCTGAPTTTLYAHMSKQNVFAGQNVQKGDIIGYVGSTGYSTGPHVHFEVRINGKPQNPNNFL